MESIIGTGGGSLTCSQLNAIFFTPTCNFLAYVFGALASATNPDFIVMSQYLNGDAKGWVSHFWLVIVLTSLMFHSDPWFELSNATGSAKPIRRAV